MVQRPSETAEYPGTGRKVRLCGGRYVVRFDLILHHKRWASLLVRYPGVEDGIQEVDRKVSKNIEQGDEEHNALNDQIVFV